MTIPDFQTIMLPLLKISSDGEEHSLSEAVEKLAEYFDLSDDEKSKLQPSGQGPVFYKRVGWARTYLKKAGLLYDPRRGYFKITNRGRRVLEEQPDKIDMKYLERFPDYIEFKDLRRIKDDVKKKTGLQEGLTPEESLEISYQEIHDELAEEIIIQILNSTPAFFEKLVVDLLVKMGYGGSIREAARAVGKTGDEGIDGIIDEDRLGLDIIYVQAKKWKPEIVVSRPEIQKFVGALQGKRARKGIFLTTSRFSNGAIEYVTNIDPKVVLIDGKRLADLIIDYDVGVSTLTTYDVKRIDSDYFGV